MAWVACVSFLLPGIYVWVIPFVLASTLCVTMLWKHLSNEHTVCQTRCISVTESVGRVHPTRCIHIPVPNERTVIIWCLGLIEWFSLVSTILSDLCKNGRRDWRSLDAVWFSFVFFLLFTWSREGRITAQWWLHLNEKWLLLGEREEKEPQAGLIFFSSLKALHWVTFTSVWLDLWSAVLYFKQIALLFYTGIVWITF